MSTKKILVIGLGNPILGDDGVGWRVAELVQERIGRQSQVEIDYLSVGGLSLMERMIGFDQVILIDAIVTGSNQLGTVCNYHLDQLPNKALGHMSSAHDTTIQNALSVGESIGANLPANIQLITIESQNVLDFSEELTPKIQAAVPIAAQKVIDVISLTIPQVSSRRNMHDIAGGKL